MTEGSDRPLTVTEITGIVRGLLEEAFPSVWVVGEIGSLSRAAANTMPSVAADPAMSHFMSAIDPAGLMHRPPASNVRPLPTNTAFFLGRAGL